MVAPAQLNSVRILKLDTFLQLVSTEDEGRAALSGAG
jgi:hypothetical protein